MERLSGTYALILRNYSKATIQIGRWGRICVKSGYYSYIGSAFGPGGVRARVSRHLRKEMIRQALLVTIAVMALSSIDARSDVPDADRHEVLHLLDYLRTSDCAMERNGERHESEDAYSHVGKKYEYFRGKIQTSEDFIEYSASKSTMSGKYYRVFCKDEPPVLTRDWLLEELRSYRERARD